MLLMRAQMHVLCNFRCITASRPSDVLCSPQTNPPMPSTCSTARRESGLRLGSVLPALILRLYLSAALPSLRPVESSMMVCGASREKYEIFCMFGISCSLTLFVTEMSGAVDIFDSVTSTWSTSELSVPRSNLAAASVGSVAIFAGGYNGTLRTAAVDIYSSAPATTAPITTAVPTSSLPSSSSPPFVTTAPPSDAQSSGSSSALPPSSVAGISIGVIIAIFAAVCLYVFRRRAYRACSSCCVCFTCCLDQDEEHSQLKQSLRPMNQA